MSTIILLLGVSSAGKTTYAQALQEYLTTYKIVGFDHLAEKKLPKKYWPGGEQEKLGFFHADTVDGPKFMYGEVGKNFLDGYQRHINQLIKSQENLIIDDVLTAEQVQEFETLANATIIKVCLKPPMHVLKQRESARGDRPVGSAEAMYHACYDELDYDICIDSSLELSKNIEEIINHLRIRLGVDILDEEMAQFQLSTNLNGCLGALT